MIFIINLQKIVKQHKSNEKNESTLSDVYFGSNASSESASSSKMHSLFYVFDPSTFHTNTQRLIMHIDQKITRALFSYKIREVCWKIHRFLVKTYLLFVGRCYFFRCSFGIFTRYTKDEENNLLNWTYLSNEIISWHVCCTTVNDALRELV